MDWGRPRQVCDARVDDRERESTNSPDLSIRGKKEAQFYGNVGVRNIYRNQPVDSNIGRQETDPGRAIRVRRRLVSGYFRLIPAALCRSYHRPAFFFRRRIRCFLWPGSTPALPYRELCGH